MNKNLFTLFMVRSMLFASIAAHAEQVTLVELRTQTPEFWKWNGGWLERNHLHWSE